MPSRFITHGIGMLLLVMLLVGTNPMMGQMAFHGDAHLEYEAALRQIDLIEEECVALLRDMSSPESMESLGKLCEDRVFHVVDQLEEWVGHEVEFVPHYKCVYSELAKHTTCFDPVFITGSG